jgi:hypothetical protein
MPPAQFSYNETSAKGASQAARHNNVRYRRLFFHQCAPSHVKGTTESRFYVPPDGLKLDKPTQCSRLGRPISRLLEDSVGSWPIDLLSVPSDVDHEVQAHRKRTYPQNRL